MLPLNNLSNFFFIKITKEIRQLHFQSNLKENTAKVNYKTKVFVINFCGSVQVMSIRSLVHIAYQCMSAYVSATKRHLVRSNIRYLTVKSNLGISADRIKEESI